MKHRGTAAARATRMLSNGIWFDGCPGKSTTRATAVVAHTRTPEETAARAAQSGATKRMSLAHRGEALRERGTTFALLGECTESSIWIFVFLLPVCRSRAPNGSQPPPKVDAAERFNEKSRLKPGGRVSTAAERIARAPTHRKKRCINTIERTKLFNAQSTERMNESHRQSSLAR